MDGAGLKSFGEPTTVEVPAGLTGNLIGKALEYMAFSILFPKKASAGDFMQAQFPELADPASKWSLTRARMENKRGTLRSIPHRALIARDVRCDYAIVVDYSAPSSQGKKVAVFEMKSGHAGANANQNEFIRALLADPGRWFEHCTGVKAFVVNVLDWDFNSHGARSMRLWVREYDGGAGGELLPRSPEGEVV